MMTPIIAAVPAAASAPLATPLPVTPQAINANDVDRLRALVAGVTPAGENVAPTTMPPPTTVEAPEGVKTFGDSILQGVAKFNTGYNDSLKGITAKLEHIAGTDPLDIGRDFGSILELQMEVAKWTMSVMGVDNASKAGTNTIKELSKGG